MPGLWAFSLQPPRCLPRTGKVSKCSDLEEKPSRIGKRRYNSTRRNHTLITLENVVSSLQQKRLSVSVNLYRPIASWQPTPVLLPGKSHGQRSLVGYSPWGLEESNRAEQLQFHFSLSYIGEGNGNPLHCSCLENPRDGGAWWTAVYGVAQSQTRPKQLSSNSSITGYLSCSI